MKKKLYLFLIFIVVGLFLLSCATHTHEFVLRFDDEGHYSYCLICGETAEKEQHSLQCHETGATCLENGEALYECEVCSYHYSVQTAPLGHELINAEREADCENDGYIYDYCTRCDYQYIYEKTRTEALGHDFSSEETFKTCTEDGYITNICERCGVVRLDGIDEASGHRLTFHEIIHEPTCTAAGEEIICCENCEYKEKITLAKASHNYSAVVDTLGELVYVCETCGDAYTGPVEELKHKGAVELFDVPQDFTFTVTASSDTLAKNIKICDVSLYGTEYENYGFQGFECTPLSDSLYKITPVGLYEKGVSYKVLLPEGVAFKEYLADELHFNVEKDMTMNVIGSDDVIFVYALETNSPGYFPYEIDTEFSSDLMYLKLGKIDGLKSEDIICIGENVASFEEIDYNNSENLYFGKIEAIYLYEDSWLLVLSCPDLTDVFDELDINHKEEIILEDYEEELPEDLEKQVVAAFMEDDQFAEFILSFSAVSEEYALMNGYDTSQMSTRAVMNGLKITPDIKINGTKLSVSLTGSASVSLRDKDTKAEYGSISVSFSALFTASFTASLKYKLKYFWFIPTKIQYFDFSISEATSFDFKFDIKIKADYSLEDTENTRKIFALNTASVNGARLHLATCFHVKQVIEHGNEKNLLYWSVKDFIDNKDSVRQYCKDCQPIESLNLTYYVLNTNPERKIVHLIDCDDVKGISSQHLDYTGKSISELETEGYALCEYCKGRMNTLLSFEDKMLYMMTSRDWQEQVEEVKEYASNSGITEHKSDGILLCRIGFAIGPFTLNLDLRLVMSFSLEASVSYAFKASQSVVYGIRLEGGKVGSYSSSNSGIDNNALELVGKVEFKIGIQADAYLSLVGLSKYVRAGITAEVGIYLDINGILHMGFSDNVYYAAAYFEVGFYAEIEAYYKLLKWTDSIEIYSNKFPFCRLGFSRAYYSYTNDSDSLNIEIGQSSYLLDKSLLEVRYYDLITMSSKTDILNLLGQDKLYDVEFSFQDGKYISFKNGTLYISDLAPYDFTDVLYIKVVGKTAWNTYVKDSSVFYLPTLEIPIHFYNEDYHVWQTEVQEATCTVGGYTRSWCLTCDIVYLEEIPALGHEYIGGICRYCTASELENEGLVSVRFNGNGGTVLIRSILVPVNGVYGNLPTPSRGGYTFVGWFTSVTGGVQISADTAVDVSESIDLYAQWTPNRYIVSFDSNGIDLQISETEVVFDAEYPSLPVITRTGYTLAGWYTVPEGGTEILSGDKVQITGNHILYAHWKKNGYLITFDSTGADLTISSMIIYYEDYFVGLPQVSKPGYDFLGWYTAPEDGVAVTEETQKLSTHNETLYARFAVQCYIVSLDATMASPIEEKLEVFFGGTYGTLPELTTDGYIFEGWFTSFVGGEKITEASIVSKTENHTLYAQWTGRTYTVSFDTNGGENEAEEIQVVFGALYGNLPTPSRDGYIFSGWFTDKTVGELITADSVVILAYNHTLYAHWVTVKNSANEII